MSENILEWRRQWTPDLSALPWIPFTIDDTNILMKSHFTQTSYTVMVYNFTSVWQEDGNTIDVKAKAKKCNPNVEAPLSKLLQHLEDLLQGEQKSAKYSLSYKDARGSGSRESSQTLCIRLASKLPQGVPFSWTLSLSRATDKMASTQMTIPLLTMLSDLMRRERELQRIIKKKDEEIEDYKMAGAKVSRKHKLTQVFDGKAFHQEMIHSKAFKSEVEGGGQLAFSGQGQNLYKEVMVTRAWLNRPPDAEDVSDDDNMAGEADPALGNAAPTGPSWVTRLPGSVAADIPSIAETLSPAKSSPSKSPVKASPSAATQDTELVRRQALEKRLAEEKLKLQSKKKKKKLF